jgi:hypothetical protein
MERDSMIFYRSFYESVNGLSPVIKAELYDAIFEYGLNFKEIEFTNEISKALFTLIKPQLDANIKRFENGKKPKTKQNESKTEAKHKQNESKVEANNNVNVNDNVNKNDSIEEPKKADNNNKNDNKNDSIEERKLKFANSLSAFLETYGRDLLNDFYFYWTEHGTNDKKLRFEKEKTFGIEQRLRTWFNRNPTQYQKNETDHLVEYVNKQLGL